MAKTSYVELDDPTRLLYFKPLASGDRFLYPHIRRNNTLLSKKRIKGLTNKSLLPIIATSWAGMTPVTKTAWSDSAAPRHTTGWRYFVGQQCLRIKNGFSGIGDPSSHHQMKVGYISLESPATHVLLIQPHPDAYWISKPVRGKKGMRELVRIVEPFTLPLTLGISYKSSLIAAGPLPSARFYAIIHYTYQGQDLYAQEGIELTLSADWNSLTSLVTSVPGLAISYNLYIELTDVTGEIWFDNINSEHSGQNWARDPYCDNINEQFTKAFFQVPKNWAPEDLPDGSFFESVFVE